MNTRNLIYLTILGAPLYLVRFEIFNIPTNILEFFIGTTFLMWLFEIKRNTSDRSSYKIFIPIILIITGLIASTLFNNNYKVGFGIIKSWFIFPIIFGFIIYSTIRKSEDIKNALEFIFLSTVLVSIISLFYYFSGNVTFDGRLRSFYLSPNHLAMFIAPGLLIGLLSSINVKASKKKIPLFLGSFIIILALYLSESYSAWIAVGISLFISTFITAYKSISNINYKKTFLIFSLVIIIILFLQQNNSKMLDLINLNERSSLASRITIWKSSLKILSDNWAAGIGPGNFQEKYLEYQQYFPPYLEWAVPQPHNLYLAFWLQGGILGILGFIWLIYKWIRIQFSFFKNSKNKKQLIIILLAVMIYFLIHGLVDTPYWKNDLSLIFWIIFFLGLIKPPAYPKQILYH